LPTAPLDDLYGARLAEWFAAHNVAARLQCAVKRVVVGDLGSVAGQRAVEVELRSGEKIAADHVVLAVPQNLVLGLLPEEWQTHSDFEGISRLETAPISSVHLWFDRPITDLRHATFVGRLSQWLFNRSAIQDALECAGPHDGLTNPGVNTPGSPNPKSEIRNPKLHYYQVVISASRDVLERGTEETVRQVVEELAAIWPVVRQAHLVHSRLVTEHKAVVSMLPGVDKLRPQQQSPIGNVQLAGDWTHTGWPGTMEGAVRSGYLAAENVLRRSGSPAKLLRPDLQVALLSKLMFGL
jgi:uncharacterized protein with NAD-binding domain and iron-sulfur cluster